MNYELPNSGMLQGGKIKFEEFTPKWQKNILNGISMKGASPDNFKEVFKHDT